MFIYDGKKIRGPWTHVDGTSFPRGWVEGADAEQLTRYAVTEVANPVPPAFDKTTHQLVEQVDGTWVLLEYPAEQIASDAAQRDINTVKEKGKDLALVVVELVDYLLANTDMAATDFTPEVKQAYLDIKVIADRIKSN